MKIVGAQAAPLTSADEVASFHAARTRHTVKVEWLDDAGRATARDKSTRVRLTKRVGGAQLALRVVVRPEAAEALMRGPLL